MLSLVVSVEELHVSFQSLVVIHVTQLWDVKIALIVGMEGHLDWKKVVQNAEPRGDYQKPLS